MENPDQPEWRWGAAVSEVDGRWLELSVSGDTSRVRLSTFSVDDLLTGVQKKLLWLADLEKEPIGPNLNWIKLVDDFEDKYSVYVIS